MIVYPESGYNSFVSVDDADSYFADRLHVDDWTGATDEIKQDALMTSYRSLSELNIVIDLTDTTALTAIKQAQLEQALHELKNDLDEMKASQVSLGGLLNVKLKDKPEQPPRFNKRAMGLLRPYLRAPVITRIR